jgi:predicted O-methyltransferase YrrM
MEDEHTRLALDELAAELIAALAGEGFFGGAPGVFDATAYDALRRRVSESFVVPDTAITTIAARVLFAIASSLRPNMTVGVGTYYGNALVWLGGARLLEADRRDMQLVACDRDPVASDGATDNFRRLGAADVTTCVVEDGEAWLRRGNATIDVLYLDVDDPVERKAAYRRMLDAALARLGPGSLVIAHDRCVAKFASDFDEYMGAIRRSGRFRRSITLPIDSCGMELSLC